MNIQISFGEGKFASEAIIGMVAAVMVIVGSVGPWATVTSGFGSVSANGTSGDGIFTLVLAIAALFWLIRYLTNEDSSTGNLIWIAVLFGISFGIALYTSNNLSELIDSEAGNAYVRMSEGWGLTIVQIASFVGAADLGFAAFKSGRQAN